MKRWRHIMRNLIGIDIEELDRFSDKLEGKFIEKILSKEELKIYQTFTHEHRKLTFIAGRFAAKEAYTKAYQSFDQPLNFKDVSILNDASGAPYIQSKYRPKDALMISIAHSKNTVVAVVTGTTHD